MPGRPEDQPGKLTRRQLLIGGGATLLGLGALAWALENGNPPEQVSWQQLHDSPAAYDGHRIQILTYGITGGQDFPLLVQDHDIFQGNLGHTNQANVTLYVEMYPSLQAALTSQNPNSTPATNPFLMAVDTEVAPPPIPFIRPNTSYRDIITKVAMQFNELALYQLVGTWTKNTGQITFPSQTTPYFLPVEEATVLQILN